MKAKQDQRRSSSRFPDISDSSRPKSFPRRVLLAVTGLSPQVVTETLYALTQNAAPAFVPTEVHLLTTAEGAARARLLLLSEKPGWFHRLRRDFKLPDIEFSGETIHALKAADGTPIVDIRTREENERLADALTGIIHELTRDGSCALHVSIAGGRKTMGFYAGYALSLFGRPQDLVFEDFADDVNDSSFDAGYVFIEPAYDTTPGNHFEDGSSQHPLGSVAAGERFIKATYEAIRKSPIWGQSLLIITWDEHGGFYDHVAPGSAPPTGSIGRKHGFTFEHLGPRVPAVIVSPLIPKNLIEHRRLEHASIPATLIDLFKLPELQHSRTQSVSGIKHLAHLQTPRTDTPLTLHSVEVAAKPKPAFFDVVAREPNAPLSKDPDGSLADLIRWVVAQHLQVAPNQRKAILARARQLQTHADALAYMKEVHGLVRAERVKAGIVRAKRVKAGLAHD